MSSATGHLTRQFPLPCNIISIMCRSSRCLVLPSSEHVAFCECVCVCLCVPHAIFEPSHRTASTLDIQQMVEPLPACRSSAQRTGRHVSSTSTACVFTMQTQRGKLSDMKMWRRCQRTASYICMRYQVCTMISKHIAQTIVLSMAKSFYIRYALFWIWCKTSLSDVRDSLKCICHLLRARTRTHTQLHI